MTGGVAEDPRVDGKPRLGVSAVFCGMLDSAERRAKVWFQAGHSSGCCSRGLRGELEKPG